MAFTICSPLQVSTLITLTICCSDISTSVSLNQDSIVIFCYFVVYISWYQVKLVIDTIDDIQLAHHKTNTTISYIMATKEHEAAPSNPTPTSKDNADNNQAIFKTAHNNPEEASAYVKDVTTLVNTFMTHIHSFNRYKKLAAYQNFVFNLDK